MFSFPEYPQGMCETMIMSQTAKKNPESCKDTKKDFEKKKKGEECVILLLSQMSWLSSGSLS